MKDREVLIIIERHENVHPLERLSYNVISIVHRFVFEFHAAQTKDLWM